MEDAYAATEKLLNENLDTLHVIAQALIERETLDENEINELVEYGHILTAEERLYLKQQKEAEQAAAEAVSEAAPENE